MVAGQLPSYLLGATQIPTLAAASTIDQSNAINPTGSGYSFSHSTGAEVGQTVTAGITGTLDAVDLAVTCTTGAVLTVQITTVDALGRPGASALAALAVNGPLANDGTFKHFGFAAPATFAAGQQFAIVMLETGTASGVSCSTLHGAPGDPYSGGNGYYGNNSSGGWIPLTTDVGMDWPFQTYVTAVPAADVAINGNTADQTDPAHPQFSVNVVNFGPNDATGATVSYTFTGPGIIHGWNQTQPGTCTELALTLTCPVSPFAVHAGYSNTIFLDRTGPGTITETATIHATEFDPRPANTSRAG